MTGDSTEDPPDLRRSDDRMRSAVAVLHTAVRFFCPRYGNTLPAVPMSPLGRFEPSTCAPRHKPRALPATGPIRQSRTEYDRRIARHARQCQ